MHVTVGKNLEIVMQEIAVCEFSAVPVVDPHRQLQYFAAQMQFDQRQKASRALTVPVRHLAQRSTHSECLRLQYSPRGRKTIFLPDNTGWVAHSRR